MKKREKITKRSFLKRMAAIGGMLVIPGKGKNMFGVFDDLISEKKSKLPLMPIVQFGDYKVSKLVIGSNPMEGVSHFSDEMNKAMLDYCSKENVLEVLRMCEENGINTWQTHGTEHFMELLDTHREQGSKMNWIVSSSVREPEKFRNNVKMLMTRKPIAFYHWGAATDKYWREGRIDIVEEQLKMIRDQGVLVGVASHNHKILEYMEERDWDVDFYMACFYNPNKKRELRDNGKLKPAPEYYGDEDRVAMCKFIRQTKKFCFGFKILAAGRNATTTEEVRKAFKYALTNIKKGDAVIVGMFLPYHVRDNTRYVKEI